MHSYDLCIVLSYSRLLTESTYVVYGTSTFNDRPDSVTYEHKSHHLEVMGTRLALSISPLRCFFL